MAWYGALAERMKAFAMPDWEDLPDLGLYMDQVITYVERQYRPVYGEGKRIITPSMINNYVKSGLVARPLHKKYDRLQLAQLMILCALKQVLPLESLGQLLTPAQGEDMESLYREFCGQQAAVAQDMAEVISSLGPLQCAVQAAVFQLLCVESLEAEISHKE